MVVRELEPLNISIRSRGWWMDRCVARQMRMLLMCCNQKQRHGRDEAATKTRKQRWNVLKPYVWCANAHIALVVLDHRLRKCNVIIRKLCLHGHYSGYYAPHGATSFRRSNIDEWQRRRKRDLRIWNRAEDVHQNDLCDKRNENSYRWSASPIAVAVNRTSTERHVHERKNDFRFFYLILRVPFICIP